MLRRTFLTQSVALAALGLTSITSKASSGDLQCESADVARNLFDQSRNREIELKVYENAGKRAGNGSTPIILFSHGLGGSKEGGAAWGQYWACQGFMSIHLQHPGSDGAAVRRGGDGASGGRGGMRDAMSPQQLVERIKDIRFVIDQLMARTQPWMRIADTNAIGLAGHSFGAITAQWAAGQTAGSASGRLTGSRLLQRRGGESQTAGMSLKESRIKAFIALSPSMRERDSADSFAGIDRPFFCITGTNDGKVGGVIGVEPAQRVAVYDAIGGTSSGKANKYLLVLNGADHMFFNGHFSTASAHAQMAQHVQHSSNLFWRAHLLQDAQAKAQLMQYQSALGSLGSFKAG